MIIALLTMVVAPINEHFSYKQFLNNAGLHAPSEPPPSVNDYWNEPKTFNVHFYISQTDSQEHGQEIFERYRSTFARRGSTYIFQTPSLTPIGLGMYLSPGNNTDQAYVWGNQAFLRRTANVRLERRNGVPTPVKELNEHREFLEAATRYALAEEEAKQFELGTYQGSTAYQDRLGNLYLPVNDWATRNQATVEFDEENALVTLTKGEATLKVRLASPQYTIDGQTKETTTFPVLKNGKICLPLNMLEGS